MPSTPRRDQPRWPAGTPGGIGGQWRPDMRPDAEALFLGFATIFQDAGRRTPSRRTYFRQKMKQVNLKLKELQERHASETPLDRTEVEEALRDLASELSLGDSGRVLQEPIHSVGSDAPNDILDAAASSAPEPRIDTPPRLRGRVPGQRVGDRPEQANDRRRLHPDSISQMPRSELERRIANLEDRGGTGTTSDAIAAENARRMRDELRNRGPQGPETTGERTAHDYSLRASPARNSVTGNLRNVRAMNDANLQALVRQMQDRVLPGRTDTPQWAEEDPDATVAINAELIQRHINGRMTNTDLLSGPEESDPGPTVPDPIRHYSGSPGQQAAQAEAALTGAGLPNGSGEVAEEVLRSQYSQGFINYVDYRSGPDDEIREAAEAAVGGVGPPSISAGGTTLRTGDRFTTRSEAPGVGPLVGEVTDIQPGQSITVSWDRPNPQGETRSRFEWNNALAIMENGGWLSFADADRPAPDDQSASARAFRAQGSGIPTPEEIRADPGLAVGLYRTSVSGGSPRRIASFDLGRGLNGRYTYEDGESVGLGILVSRPERLRTAEQVGGAVGPVANPRGSRTQPPPLNTENLPPRLRYSAGHEHTAGNMVQLADSQVPGDDTAGLDIVSTRSYSRIVDGVSGETIAYVRPNRIRFARGEDTTLDGISPPTDGPGNHQPNSYRTTARLASANDERRARVGQSLLLASRQFPRNATGRTRGAGPIRARDLRPGDQVNMTHERTFTVTRVFSDIGRMDGDFRFGDGTTSEGESRSFEFIDQGLNSGDFAVARGGAHVSQPPPEPAQYMGGLTREQVRRPSVKVRGMAQNPNGDIDPSFDDLDGRNFGIEIEFKGMEPDDVVRKLRERNLPTYDAINHYTYRTANHVGFGVDSDNAGIGGHDTPEFKTNVLVGPDGDEIMRAGVEALADMTRTEGLTTRPVSHRGLHVHVDVRDLNREQVMKAAKSYDKNSALIDNLFPEARRGTSWARPGIGHDSHTHAVNITSKGTLEFRRAAASTNALRILDWTTMLRMIIQRIANGEDELPAYGQLAQLLDGLGINDPMRARILQRAADYSAGRTPSV